MTREQFYMKLWKLGISSTDLLDFFNEVLEKEEDSLRYIDHVRKFFNEKELEFGTGKNFNFNLLRTMISVLHAFRTSNGYDPSPVAFHEFMPRPSKEAISMAEWHCLKKRREHQGNSKKRRGFYRNGEPTQDCGTDLQEYLLFYEYETKGKKTRA